MNDQKITSENARITTHDGEPAIELPTGQILKLRTFVKVEGDQDDRLVGREVSTKTEVDADDFAWWTIFPDGDGDFPEVVIEPEVLEE